MVTPGQTPESPAHGTDSVLIPCALHWTMLHEAALSVFVDFCSHRTYNSAWHLVHMPGIFVNEWIHKLRNWTNTLNVRLWPCPSNHTEGISWSSPYKALSDFRKWAASSSAHWTQYLCWGPSPALVNRQCSCLSQVWFRPCESLVGSQKQHYPQRVPPVSDTSQFCQTHRE